MFEIIGLLFATAAFLGLSGVLGCVYATIAWFILRKRRRRRKTFLTLLAGLLPPAFAAYIAVCSIIFAFTIPGQGDRLFGDTYEPLPNGYVLKALGKMPDFAGVYPKSDSGFEPQLLGYVRSIQVEGSRVYGEYSNRFSESAWTDGASHGYFVFDTRDRSIRNFDTMAELAASAGHQLHLVKATDFRSQDTSYRRFLRLRNLLLFGPPAAATLAYFLFLVKTRRSREAIESLP